LEEADELLAESPGSEPIDAALDRFPFWLSTT
jgi:hypothetical protein